MRQLPVSNFRTLIIAAFGALVWLITAGAAYGQTGTSGSSSTGTGSGASEITSRSATQGKGAAKPIGAPKAQPQTTRRDEVAGSLFGDGAAGSALARNTMLGEFRVGWTDNGAPSLASVIGGSGQSAHVQLGVVLGESQDRAIAGGDAGKRVPVSVGLGVSTRFPEVSFDPSEWEPAFQLEVGVGLWATGRVVQVGTEDAPKIDSSYIGTAAWQAGMVYHYSPRNALTVGYHSKRGIEIGYGQVF